MKFFADADMGTDNSVVASGWLADNSLEDIMETYLERIVGEHNCNWYGRLFPLFIRFKNTEERLPVMVHPDDALAEERYDSLGKNKLWYIMDAEPGSKIYLGFNKEMSAQELYDRCMNSTLEEVLNVIEPEKGDAILVKAGTVHSADKGFKILEVQEASDLDFNISHWGDEFGPDASLETYLEEAIDFIDYNAVDPGLWIKGEGHDHKIVNNLVQIPEFTVNKINLTDTLHIYTEKFGSFLIYTCIEGRAEIKIAEEVYDLKKGGSILIPADMPDFFIWPCADGTALLESLVEKREDLDDYIDPDTDPFLEGEDYEGIEDECECGHKHLS